MQERRGKLNITFGRLDRHRDNGLPSASSPKSTESSPRLLIPSAGNTDHVTAPPTRPSLPASTTRSQGVQRIMTEPLRNLPPAVIARPRSVSHPPTQPAAVASTLPVRTPQRTPTERSNPSTKAQGRLRGLLNSMNFKNRSKRKTSKSGHFPLILTLLIFCMTAIVCTSSSSSFHVKPTNP